MQEYANILNYAIPAFMVLIAIEYAASCFLQVKVNRLFDTISSLSSGITNVLKDILGLSIVIVSYGWMVDHFAIFKIESSLLLYVLAFIGLDFAGYWSHRFSHVVNIFWNRHIIHHSSEEFNLACALRQSASEIFVIFTFLYIPMAIIGIPTNVIGIIAPLHLFAQFWYHTRLIDKMGLLEYILVTPSHHRVHHAINLIYMDKNYSQIFIIWDRIFGTFQLELKEEVAVYGVSRAVQTWNPWLINFQHMWLLIKDAWRTNSWQDKITIWFKPTGYRPADVASKYPVPYTEDVHNRPKYDTDASLLLKIWSSLQLVITLGLMMFLFNHIGSLAPMMILMYGIFLFISVFAYTSLMDGDIISLLAEGVKLTLGCWLIWSNGQSWFGIEDSIPNGTLIMTSYLILSMVATFYFYLADRPQAVSLHSFDGA